MSLRYALLAVLHDKPATGYELTQAFKTRLFNVWNASHQQIYRELGRLLNEQLLLVEPVAQAGKPDKKRYHVTLSGESALEAWLNKPQAHAATRDPLLVKLLGGDLLDTGQFKYELEMLRKDCIGQLGNYRVIEHTYFRQPEALPQRNRQQHLALRCGMLKLEATLTWLDEAEDAFAQTEEP